MLGRDPKKRATKQPVMFDEDDDSLSGSVVSFDPDHLMQSATLSAIEAEDDESSDAESDMSNTPFSPPGWKKEVSGYGRLFNLQAASISSSTSREGSKSRSPAKGAGSRSRSTRSIRSAMRIGSPLEDIMGSVEGDEEDDLDDTLHPANVPLPISPLKQTPRNTASMSPEKKIFDRDDALSSIESDEREVSVQPTEPEDNYFRFAVRAEVRHRTEPVESAIQYIFTKINNAFQLRWLVGGSMLTGLIAILLIKAALFRIPDSPPLPDLHRATQIVRTFEPMMYYSENGLRQVSELQDTSVAVWDLGETLRSADMTSASIIVGQLDTLGKNLENLVIELTKFFVNVDGDIDSIILVMEWAKRTLMTIEPINPNSLSTAVDNMHGAMRHMGLHVLETPAGTPTVLGRMTRMIFGSTALQRNVATLRKTFNEFLNVMEESINTELQHSIRLLALFETTDQLYLNLHRSVSREDREQERSEDELLSSIWSHLLRGRTKQLKKFERNRRLLGSIRNQTTANKRVLREHSTNLLLMKSKLDSLRQKLTTQLVSRHKGISNGSDANRRDGGEVSVLGENLGLPLEEQIAGLDSTYMYLKAVRENQKIKTMGILSDKAHGMS